LKDLRESKDFFDVTLACEDEQIECHKVVLSACSPLMLKILRQNNHPHPLLYLKGVKFNHLLSLIDFMYDGQVNVSQEDLMSFMATAEELKIKGLTRSSEFNGQGIAPPLKTEKEVDNEQDVSDVSLHNNNNTTKAKSSTGNDINIDEFTFPPFDPSHIKLSVNNTNPSKPLSTQPCVSFPQNPFSLPNFENVLKKTGENTPSCPSQDEDRVCDFLQVVQDDNQEIGHQNMECNKTIISKKCKSMILKLGDLFQCSVCEFRSEKRKNIRSHVESHIPSQFRVCDLCNKSFKNRNSLRTHKSLYHKSVSTGKNITTTTKEIKFKEAFNNRRDDIISLATSDVPSASHDLLNKKVDDISALNVNTRGERGLLLRSEDRSNGGLGLGIGQEDGQMLKKMKSVGRESVTKCDRNSESESENGDTSEEDGENGFLGSSEDKEDKHKKFRSGSWELSF